MAACVFSRVSMHRREAAPPCSVLVGVVTLFRPLHSEVCCEEPAKREIDSSLGNCADRNGSFKRRLGEALVVSSSRKQPGKLSDFHSLHGCTRACRAE